LKPLPWKRNQQNRKCTINLGGVDLLPCDNLFNTNGGLDCDHYAVVTSVPGGADFLSHGIGVMGKVKVSLLGTGFVHKSELLIFDIDNFPIGTEHNRDSGSVTGRNHIFKLSSSEDISSKKITLGVTVLSGFGNRDGEDLTRLSLDHHVSVQSKNTG
jgi:hypothetical protein